MEKFFGKDKQKAQIEKEMYIKIITSYNINTNVKAQLGSKSNDELKELADMIQSVDVNMQGFAKNGLNCIDKIHELTTLLTELEAPFKQEKEKHIQTIETYTLHKSVKGQLNNQSNIVLEQLVGKLENVKANRPASAASSLRDSKNIQELTDLLTVYERLIEREKAAAKNKPQLIATINKKTDISKGKLEGVEIEETL